MNPFFKLKQYNSGTKDREGWLDQTGRANVSDPVEVAARCCPRAGFAWVTLGLGVLSGAALGQFWEP